MCEGVDIGSTLMQPEDYDEGREVRAQTPEGPGTLLLHVNSPLLPLAMLRLGRRVIQDKYIVGCWAWELPSVPADWRQGVAFVHEIWVPSSFVAAAVISIAGDRPVRVVPYSVSLRRWQARRTAHGAGRPFTVLTIFNMASSFARKNPLAAIAAFRSAFGDDPATRLVVKTSNTSAFPSGITAIRDAMRKAHNIDLIDRTMSATEIDELYQECDVVISLHRSEGFGLTIAEAMLRGLPVLATNWSGNVDFLTPDNGMPIPYQLVPAEDPQGTYNFADMSWAEADVETAAAALRRLRQDPELTRRLGQAGAAYAARQWSARGYAETVRRHLGL